MSLANIQEFISPLVNGPLILADQNGPKPAKPFATLSVRSAVPFRPIRLIPDENGSQANIQGMYLSIEIQSFGVTAFSDAHLTALKLRFETNSMRAESLGLGVSRITNITRVPELLSQSQFEERAIVEVTMYDALIAQDDVGLIESAIVEGESDSGISTYSCG